MTPVTPGWTEDHTRVARLVALVGLGALTGLGEAAPVSVWVVAAVAAATLVSLALDFWGGLLCGVASATALVAAREWAGYWTSEHFLPALLETVAIMAAAAEAGRVGMRLRERVRDRGVVPQESAWASDGLIDDAAAMARLEEEVADRERHGSPLCLALFEVRARAGRAVEDADLAAAGQAVARVVAGRTAALDVPFASGPRAFGIVFPHAAGRVAWETVGAILDGARTVPLHATGDTRSAADVAVVDAAVSEQSTRRRSAGEMVAEARAALAAAAAATPAEVEVP